MLSPGGAPAHRLASARPRGISWPHHLPPFSIPKEDAVKRFLTAALCGAFVLAIVPALSQGADDKKSDDAAAKPAAGQPKADADGFFSLFNGKDLEGWKISEH